MTNDNLENAVDALSPTGGETITPTVGHSILAGNKAGPLTQTIPTAEPTERVKGRYIASLVAANFGTSMAFILPLAYTLALKVNSIAPGHEELQGYVVGTAALVWILTAPLVGLWSDRTRSRLGRRRPFVLGGAVIGVVGLAILSLAPNVLVLGLGWVIGSMAWGTAQAAIQNVQADRLPDSQRGKVSGLIAMSSQVAPIIGIGIAYALSKNIFLVFVVPALVGLALCLFYLIKDKEDSRSMPMHDRLTIRSIFAAYVFNVRQFPSFAWNWVGRFVFFMALYFNTTFGTFFYAQRLNLPIVEVAGVASLIGLFGVLAAVAGALGVGFISDRLARRKLFILIGGLAFLAGAVTEAFAHSLPPLIVGAVIMQLALASFGTVDQAIVLAVLPDRSEAARYIAIINLAQKIPSGIAPVIAASIITIGAAGGEKNYTVLYLIGGVFAIIGAFLITTRVKGVR